MPTSRILVVDDFKDWRWMVCSILQTQAELLVVDEAADGVEAVQKAEALKPDLIVLDIGLPKLNGITAAMRISELSPISKILFLSQDNDTDLVQAALNTGAAGYVHKSSAGTELLPAVAAVLRGRSFVSGGISLGHIGHDPVATAPHLERFEFRTP